MKFSSLPAIGSDHSMAMFYADWNGSWLNMEDGTEGEDLQLVSRGNGVVKSGYAPNVNDWHHYAMVYSGSGATDKLTLYVDHNPVATSTASWSLGASHYNIGMFHGNPSYAEWLDGLVDEVRISDTALDTSGMMAAVVPEPATIGLLAIGSIFLSRKKK